MAGATQPPDYYLQRTDMSCNLPTLDQKAPMRVSHFEFRSNPIIEGPTPTTLELTSLPSSSSQTAVWRTPVTRGTVRNDRRNPSLGPS